MKNLREIVCVEYNNQLNESILSSTKTGARPLIEMWCHEHIAFDRFGIDDNLDITCANKNGQVFNLLVKNISSKNDVPSYICFGHLEGGFHSDTILKYLSQEQLPKYCNWFYFSGNIGSLEDIELHLGNAFIVNALPNRLKSIKNVKLYFANNLMHSNYIDLSNTMISTDDLHELTVVNCDKLNIENTPAAKTIMKDIKKFGKSSSQQLNDYCNDMFGQLEGIRFIELSKRLSIEHNHKDNNWYIF